MSAKSLASRVKAIFTTTLKDGPKTTKYLESVLKDAGIPPDFQWQREANKVAMTRPIKGRGNHAGWEWVLPETSDVIE